MIPNRARTKFRPSTVRADPAQTNRARVKFTTTMRGLADRAAAWSMARAPLRRDGIKKRRGRNTKSSCEAGDGFDTGITCAPFKIADIAALHLGAER